MKRMIAFFLILAACASPKSENAESTNIDEVVNEVADEQEEPSDFFRLGDDLKGKQLSIWGVKKNAEFHLRRMYVQRFALADNATDEENAKHLVTSATVLDGKFFAVENKCEDRSVVLTSRYSMEEDKEYFDLFFLTQAADGEPIPEWRETLDGSEGPADVKVSLQAENLSPNCKVITVVSSLDGGDISLVRKQEVTFYIYDGHKSFYDILNLTLEDTLVQDYEGTQDMNKNSKIETRSYNILKTINNGLYDIGVHFTRKEDGKIVQEQDEVYTFDGENYVRKT